MNLDQHRQKTLPSYGAQLGFILPSSLGKEVEKINATSRKVCSFYEKPLMAERIFEIDKKNPGAVLPTKNHQGGLQDDEDKSDGKCFASPDSPRCPVATLKAYLSHLNPLNESLFQRPRPGSNKFNLANERIWFSNSPVGENTLGSFLKNMSVRAGIVPHLMNHCIRATLVTVLSEANYPSRYIMGVTGHKSETSLESYNKSATFKQKKSHL